MPSWVRRERSSGTARPKSPIFGGAVGGQPDVAGLEVAMDDAAARARTPAPGRRCSAISQRVAISARALSGALSSRPSTSPPAISSRDEVGLAALVADVEDGDDVRVGAEAAHRLRLARDRARADLVEALGLDQREGDVAVELRVVGEVDALLAALAEEARDRVAPVRDRLPDPLPDPPRARRRNRRGQRFPARFRHRSLHSGPCRSPRLERSAVRRARRWTGPRSRARSSEKTPLRCLPSATAPRSGRRTRSTQA